MNDELIVVLSVAIVTYLVLSNDKAKIESMTGGSDELLNIYDEPLEACPDNQYESNGSWMVGNKKCSERGGGVHQICYRDIGTNANKFSLNTGQSDWSTERGDQNKHDRGGGADFWDKHAQAQAVEREGPGAHPHD